MMIIHNFNLEDFYIGNNNNFEFGGRDIYLANKDTGEAANVKLYMKEIRIWTSWRTQHDLQFNKHLYLDKYYPAYLEAYWKIEYDPKNFKSIKDFSINNLGKQELINEND